jgi:hypothetical protein
MIRRWQYIPGFTQGLYPCKMWRGLPVLDGGIFDNIPDPAGDQFGIFSSQSLRETFMRPTLRAEEGHFICRDPDAPLMQVGSWGQASRCASVCVSLRCGAEGSCVGTPHLVMNRHLV